MTRAERAILAAKEVTGVGGATVAVYDAVNPYCVVTSGLFNDEPWTPSYIIRGIPVYHRGPGQIVPPRPTCEP